MKDAQKPDHISLNSLLAHLREGRFVIPDFQRDFEWEPWDIRDLLRSIFLDYYIGSLLLWRGKSDTYEALSCEPIYGFQGTANPIHVVLDGQQRLTAMHYAFHAPDMRLPNRKNRAVYFIRVDRFMADELDEAFGYDWRSQRLDKVLADRTLQFEEHLFPISVVGRGGWELFSWVQDYSNHWNQKAAVLTGEEKEAALRYAKHGREFGEHVKDISEKYQISFVELDRDLQIEKVCDIFTQINSKGIRLDIFDLMNALLKPKDVKLKQMWREAKERLSFVPDKRLNIYVLQVMSILLQNYCSPKYLYYMLPGVKRTLRNEDGTMRREELVPDAGTFEAMWREAVDAIERAIKMLRHPHEFGVVSADYLPYVSIIPVFSALQTVASSLPSSRRLTAQRKIRHWYWASIFTNRYSGSVESTSARDFIDVQAWIRDDDAVPAVLTEFNQRFPSLDLQGETRRGSAIYNAVFNLFVLAGARDWVSGNIPQPEELDDHHIVPQSWTSRDEVGDRIHSILNRAPLTADTNRNVIRARLPNEYLPELIRECGERAVRKNLETHHISTRAFEILLRNPFTSTDFQEFIAERQRTIQDAIENLLVKEHLDLSPALKDLDGRIESIETALRNVIAQNLDDEFDHVPPHVMQKVKERIRGATKKNALLNGADYSRLKGMLEYFDLREIEQTITYKSAWPSFEEMFASKETLVKRFDQMAELRNAIRHSRSIDPVMRREGEAALLWFESLLKSREAAAWQPGSELSASKQGRAS